MDKTIESIIEPWKNDVSETRNWAIIFLAIIFFVTGITVIMISAFSSALIGANAIYCFSVGAILLCLCIILMIMRGSNLVYLPTKSPIRTQHKYVNYAEWSKEATTLGATEPIPFNGEGAIRIDTLKSDDGHFNVFAVSQFIEFDYQIIYTHRVE